MLASAYDAVVNQLSVQHQASGATTSMSLILQAAQQALSCLAQLPEDSAEQALLISADAQNRIVQEGSASLAQSTAKSPISSRKLSSYKQA